MRNSSTAARPSWCHNEALIEPVRVASRKAVKRVALAVVKAFLDWTGTPKSKHLRGGKSLDRYQYVRNRSLYETGVHVSGFRHWQIAGTLCTISKWPLNSPKEVKMRKSLARLGWQPRPPIAGERKAERFWSKEMREELASVKQTWIEKTSSYVGELSQDKFQQLEALTTNLWRLIVARIRPHAPVRRLTQAVKAAVDSEP